MNKQINTNQQDTNNGKALPNDQTNSVKRHNNPYATRRHINGLHCQILSEAFRVVYDHAQYFYGEPLSFRRFSVLTCLPMKTLHRIYNFDVRLHPRTAHRLNEYLSSDKFSDIIAYSRNKVNSEEIIAFNRSLAHNRLFFVSGKRHK